MEDGCDAVQGGGAGFGFEGRFGVAEVEVGVGIDDAGEDDAVGGIDGFGGVGVRAGLKVGGDTAVSDGEIDSALAAAVWEDDFRATY